MLAERGHRTVAPGAAGIASRRCRVRDRAARRADGDAAQMRVMRPRSAGLLTRAKAMPAAMSFSSNASAFCAANTLATRPSVSGRRFTRSTLVAKFGSAASAASPSTLSASTRRDENVDSVTAAERAVRRNRRMRKADPCGGAPASCCKSGTVIQSAMASNIEIDRAAPAPVRSRTISASRISS